MPRPVEAQRQVDARAPRMEKLRANRDGIRSIARRLGASNVRIFGSVARGDDGPESDVDLLVDLDVHTRGLLPLVAIGDEVSALLRERVDVVAASALAPNIVDSTLAEAVPL